MPIVELLGHAFDLLTYDFIITVGEEVNDFIFDSGDNIVIVDYDDLQMYSETSRSYTFNRILKETSRAGKGVPAGTPAPRIKPDCIIKGKVSGNYVESIESVGLMKNLFFF